MVDTKISDLTALPFAENNDELPIVDTSNSETKKISFSNLTGSFAVSGGAYHDGFSDYVADEHIDWTIDQGATNINAGNYTDTTYTSSDFDHSGLTNAHNLSTDLSPVWANINFTTSDIGDITTKSHTSLSDIGTITHSQLETNINNTSGAGVIVSGATVTNKNNLTTVSGAYIVTSGTLVTDIANLITVSGAGVLNKTNLTTVSGALVTDISNLETVSGAYYSHKEDSTIHYTNPGFALDSRVTTISGAYVVTSGALVNDIVNLTTVSGAGVSATNQLVKNTGSISNNLSFISDVSGSYIVTSGALVTDISNLNTVSGAGVTLQGNYITTSGALVTDIANLVTVSGAGVINKDNLIIVSGATVTNKDNITTISGAGVAVSGALVTDISNLVTISGATVTNKNNLITVSGAGLIVSGAYVSTSGALVTDISNLTAVSGALVTDIANLVTVSGAVYAGSVSLQAVSGALFTIEGTSILSTGETGSAKYLRTDADDTCSWQTVADGGDVSKVGTPLDNQVGIWTGDGTLGGSPSLTFDGTDLTCTGEISGTNITTISGATVTNKNDIITVSGAALVISGALVTDIANLVTVSGANYAGSVSLLAVSGADYGHRNDNTQAHSDYLLNTGADEAVGPLTVTADNSTRNQAYIPMVLYDSGATPPNASGVPIGTLFIQYTA